jgi:prepilin-type N-terminal cleavage/methylation domain-containing protein
MSQPHAARSPKEHTPRCYGFTLVEILVAITLVGVLGAIAVVGVSSLTSSGASAGCAASVDAANTAAKNHTLLEGEPPQRIADLVTSGGLTIPAGASLDATGTVLTGPNTTLVMRRGAAPVFSCSLADRSYDAAARAVPGSTGYIRFGDPAATDLVGGTGFIWPASATTAAGVIGDDTDGAVQFAGVGGVQAGPYTAVDRNDWDIGTGSLTVAFWYRDDSPADGTVVRKSDGANFNGWIVDQAASGALGCRVDTNGGPAAWTPPLSPGVWRHIACVIDRDTDQIRVHVDGSVAATASIASLAGRNLDANSGLTTNLYGRLSGRLDELGIWSRALSTAEVGELAAAT